jgi:glycosyltransferase involved in cell wall biosynthesis
MPSPCSVQFAGGALNQGVMRPMLSRIVLSVPHPPASRASHPGGQLTAASGLIEYLSRRQIEYLVLDTFSSSYPPVPFRAKFFQSIARVFRGCRAARHADTGSYLAFSGFGLSLLERCCIALVFRLSRKPSVIFFRNSEILGLSLSSGRRRFLSTLIKCPTHIVVQGFALAEKMRWLGARSVTVIPNWLPVGYGVSNSVKCYPDDGIVNFLFVGWLERAKGVAELMEAVVLLQPIAPRFRLHLVGSGAMESEVSSVIRNLPAGNVITYGWMSSSEVKHLQSKCQVFVLPSHNEGFPNALLEAMAEGLAVISTSVGAIPDSIMSGSNGLLVAPKSVQELAGAMRSYIEDPTLIPAHSAAVLSSVRRTHDRDDNCGRLIGLLNRAKAR